MAQQVKQLDNFVAVILINILAGIRLPPKNSYGLGGRAAAPNAFVGGHNRIAGGVSQKVKGLNKSNAPVQSFLVQVG